METRVAAVLLQILEGVKKGESIQRVKTHLLESGHSAGDVNLALSYLLHVSEAQADLPADERPDQSSGIRVLGEAERFVLSAEAYGYLLKLRELRLISALEMEQIVEDLLISTDDTAGLEEVKTAVAKFLIEGSFPHGLPHPEEEPETEH